MSASEGMKRAVFLDRDGTIIEDVDYLTEIDQIRLLPGVADALRRLKRAGFLLLVVTNQSAVARGRLTEQELALIHDELDSRLARQGVNIDAFYYCPHLPGAEVEHYDVVCNCRKPEPGLFEEAVAEWHVNPAESYAVGDSRRDVQAGKDAGCQTVYIGHEETEADFQAPDLSAAADTIMERERG
ncbi:MAG: D-glycero-alpha-D-manno-heptose-1,7-bisphosphate 7-phosphatase [Planctomycetota bacterium]